MIRVLVVDDDKMARKGLILTAPWSNFGMTVVGEASNGHLALEFLEETPVDLVLTDLAMPLMDGIELMQVSTRKHPSLRFAILSFHQEFALVQDALRLGAIDFIAKQDLEREQIERVLHRIRDRFVRNAEGAHGWSTKPEGRGRCCPWNDAVAYLRQSAVGPFPLESAEALDQDLFLMPCLGDGESILGWGRARLSGLLNEPFLALGLRLASYRQHGWFYDQNTETVPIVTWQAFEAETQLRTDSELSELRDRLLSYAWIFDADADRSLRAQLRTMRIPPAQLLALLDVVRDLWARDHSTIKAKDLPPAYGRSSWNQIEEWFAEFRTRILEELPGPRFAPYVHASITRATRYINSEYAKELGLGDIAQLVNMSRSHFSECFRQITGKTFLDFLRAVRMEAARKHLITTPASIAQVGESVGYLDEKYFSRQFRDFFGVVPSEYRRLHRKG